MSRVTVHDLVTAFEAMMPVELAESWDNVGLLLGDRQSVVERVMTCLTLTPDVAHEAINRGAQLIATHHPIMFRPVQAITSDTPQGTMLLELIRHGVAVYSPHTAFDSSLDGINAQLARLLELEDVAPLRIPEGNSSDPVPGGTGRVGRFATARPLQVILAALQQQLGLEAVQYVGDADQTIERLAIACGAGGSFLDDAIRAGSQAFLTGEARFHSCLAARTAGVALIVIGHYGSERHGVETLANQVSHRFPNLEVWASETETDPLCWYGPTP